MWHHPDPVLLQSFVAIVENGSFTSAAKRIHRTQSAVSMQVRRLEEIMECSLFERIGRTVRLTNEGEVFYDHARRILAAYRDALAAFEGSSLEGEVSIGLPDDFASSHLPSILSRFSRLYPKVHLHLSCEPSRRLITQISEGSIDVALVTEGEGTISGVVVHREPLIWVSSAQHNAHNEDPVSLAIFHTSDVFRRYAIEQLQVLGRRATIKVASPSYAGISAAVDAGIAVAALFRSSIKPGWRTLTIQDGYPDLPEFGIVLLRSKRHSEIADRLAELITAVATVGRAQNGQADSSGFEDHTSVRGAAQK